MERMTCMVRIFVMLIICCSYFVIWKQAEQKGFQKGYKSGMFAEMEHQQNYIDSIINSNVYRNGIAEFE
jgi:hypothetical protein